VTQFPLKVRFLVGSVHNHFIIHNYCFSVGTGYIIQKIGLKMEIINFVGSYSESSLHEILLTFIYL
jgi:hypothetical protein